MTTKIDYVDETWNPITGCTPVSEGCVNCYAKRMAETRLRGRFGYPSDEPFRPATWHPDKLNQPIGWKKPCVIFVCSMGDLFHSHVSDSHRVAIFEVMAMAEQHTFLVLTKRPKEMARFFATEHSKFNDAGNVWLGVTVESADHLDRVEELLRIPGKHWLSLEPLLGPMDISQYLPIDTIGGVELENWPTWLVLGCESGPNRRPCEHEWMIDIVEQADTAGPVWVKQVNINGKVSHKPAEWPEKLQRREKPWKENQDLTE